MNNKIESNSVVFAGPFLGEFGWELSHWMPHVRWLREQYKGRKLIVASYAGRHPLYYGIADEFWNLPDWFTKEKYDCDCFESLCGSGVYAGLTKHFKDKLDSKYDSNNVVWTRTPRGFNKTLRDNNYVIFDKLKASGPAIKTCNELIEKHGNKPVIMLFARAMQRKKFLDVKHNQIRHCEDLRTPLPSNNWPRSHWEDLFEMLYERFNDQVTFAIGGTKSGNCLLSMSDKHSDVIDLTNVNVAQSLDVTIAMLNSALCSISSQSGPTHLSLQCGCPSFIYGHEQKRHSVDDNPLKTDVVFLETQLGMYNDSPEVLYKDATVYIKYLLGEKQDKLNGYAVAKDRRFFKTSSGKVVPTNASPTNAELKAMNIKAIDVETLDSKLREHWEEVTDKTNEIKLNLGCGNDIRKGYINIDSREINGVDRVMDISNLDYIEGSVDEIVASDILEHFPHAESNSILSGWIKLLKPSGTLFLQCPDLTVLANAFISKQISVDFFAKKLYGGQDFSGNFHYAGFDLKSMKAKLKQYGMVVEKEALYNGNFGVLARKLGSIKTKKTNILIKKIGMVGVFDSHYNIETPFGKAFANAGIHVDAFNYRTIAKEIGWDAMNLEIVKFASAYDLIIFCKCNGVTAETMRMCGRNSLTCWYMMDAKSHLDNDPHYYKMANSVDFSVVTTKAVYDALANGEKYHIPNIYHILQGIDPKENYPVDAEKKYDVVFIGQRTAKRSSILFAIEQAGYSNRAYGQGYNKPVYGEDFNKACAEGRILLAINNSDPSQDGFSDRIMRYMATRGCVLTEYSKGLEIYFMEPEFHWFKTELQMILEIKRLLSNDDLRSTTAETGYKKVLANHTWDKVAERIIKIATGEERNV